MIILALISYFITLLTFVCQHQYILPVLLCLEGTILLVILSMLFNPLTAIPQKFSTPQPKPCYRGYRHNTGKCVVGIAMYLS